MTAQTLSRPRLERLHQVLSGHVERGDMPGLVALVSCHDDVHLETIDTLSIGQSAPMQRDTLFRLASLTKPVTAVAAMILVEECKLRLDDSIEPWLPELANRRVLRSIASQLDDTVPTQRAITVRDLFTSCMGFGSVMAMPGTHPIQGPIRDLQIGGDGPPLPSRSPRERAHVERVHARARLRAAGHEGHVVPRAGGQDRPVADLLSLQSSDAATRGLRRHRRQRLARARHGTRQRRAGGKR